MSLAATGGLESPNAHKTRACVPGAFNGSIGQQVLGQPNNVQPILRGGKWIYPDERGAEYGVHNKKHTDVLAFSPDIALTSGGSRPAMVRADYDVDDSPESHGRKEAPDIHMPPLAQAPTSPDYNPGRTTRYITDIHECRLYQECLPPAPDSHMHEYGDHRYKATDIHMPQIHDWNPHAPPANEDATAHHKKRTDIHQGRSGWLY